VFLRQILLKKTINTFNIKPTVLHILLALFQSILGTVRVNSEKLHIQNSCLYSSECATHVCATIVTVSMEECNIQIFCFFNKLILVSVKLAPTKFATFVNPRKFSLIVQFSGLNTKHRMETV
jgi:hypothetical protein